MLSATDSKEHLATVERHLAEAEDRVVRQARALAWAKAAGQDTAEAEVLLRAFRQSLDRSP